MPSASDYLPGAKPKLITFITTGSGTHVPTADMARCFVRLQAGGAGGAGTTYAGGAGAMSEWLIRIPIAGMAYVIGGSGAVGIDGGKTTLGHLMAMAGGAPPGGAGGAGSGGMIGLLSGSVDADGASIAHSGVCGVSGGAGGYSSAPGWPAGFPIDIVTNNTYGAPYNFSNFTSGRNGLGNASGGNSFYGPGGVSGSAPGSTAYGAGGGLNAAGKGGCIEIWDFGA